MADNRVVVTEMSRANLSPDGGTVTIELAGEGGSSVELVFTPESLEGFAGRAGDIIALAQERLQAQSKEIGIRATDVAAAAIVVPPGAGKVILRLRSPSGVTYNFAVGHELVGNLMPQLRRAEYAARTQKAPKPARKPAAAN
jgi:hypothetical protein